MTKIDIISGFLGAGKTTFIKKLLQEAIEGEQVVLIENEFGEIGIDGGFLKDAGIEIREMNSGCICCSLSGDFGKSLKEVLMKFKPQRIIIEPSGVGKLSDVIKAVRDVAADMEVSLNSSVTVVDASKCKMYMKNFGEFFNNQIEHAGSIILSRTDIATSDQIHLAVTMIREHNGHASIVTTPVSQLDGKQLLEIIEKPDTMAEDLIREVKGHHGHKGCGGHKKHEGCGCGHKHGHEKHSDESCGCGHGHQHQEEGCGCGHNHHEHGEGCSCGGHDHEHHHAEEVFTSWGVETVKQYTKEELDAVLDELAYGSRYGEVLRAKGMLPSEKEGIWHYFDLVPEQYEIREGKPDYTGKLCVIGANLNETELNETFVRSLS